MKRSIDDLAIFGGEPAFPEPLHVGRPNLGDPERFKSAVDDIFARRWLTNDGPQVQEFEHQISQLLGVEHCIAMCNGTIALEIAIRGLGLSGEVILPSFTFVATPHALQWQQITPVFCDIGADGHNIDPYQVESLITPRTSGIIGVHVWGRPCDIASLQAIADQHKLTLMFDAAHALGCSYGGVPIGRFGRAEVLSFHATKVLNTFEGGAVVTNDGELATRLRYMRNFGFAGEDRVDYLGVNGKMHEISAAMGLSSLQNLDAVIAHNQRNHLAYRQQLADIEGIKIQLHDPNESHNYHYVVVAVDGSGDRVDRDSLVKILQQENVFARRYFYPGCHRMEPYRSYYPHAGLLLPRTEKACDEVMTLPNGTAIDTDEIEQVCQLIRTIASSWPEIRARL